MKRDIGHRRVSVDDRHPRPGSGELPFCGRKNPAGQDKSTACGTLKRDPRKYSSGFPFCLPQMGPF